MGAITEFRGIGAYTHSTAEIIYIVFILKLPIKTRQDYPKVVIDLTKPEYKPW